MEQPCFFHDGLGHRIAGLLATPDRPTDRVAVLCHGFLSHKNSTTNKTLTRVLNERGIATLRFDFFGHGESQGPFEDITTTIGIAQAVAALDEAVSRGFGRIGLVGSSFGGLVSIHAAARWPNHCAMQRESGKERLPLACLALKCPVVDFGEELRLEFGEGGIADWKTSDTIPNLLGGAGRIRLRYQFYEDCLGLIAYEPARNIVAPTLIVHGDCDELVPVEQSHRLLDSLAGQKRLELLPGADHQFSKGEDFRRMTSLLADWVSQHLASTAH
ncbi:MAG TPA: alpha/beta fold hydrolase [Nitrospiraceae bacterium]|nr:alpha/beta fold hydrolase [Nitrospiraceae bacterium]